MRETTGDSARSVEVPAANGGGTRNSATNPRAVAAASLRGDLMVYLPSQRTCTPYPREGPLHASRVITTAG